MAQTEDTELRDIVIEALEKNGSLAKIRALLRANIFLAFEEECENLRHNLRLDGVLKSPEGVAALCVVHEFLEFCNLKNTLFVYKAESRQGRDYKHDGKSLRTKLQLDPHQGKEPVLVALIKTASKQSHDDSDTSHVQECGDGAAKDEHNGSYIVHSGSGSPVSTTSPCSPAERTRLQLRLPLDHSDTDSSSDGSRGQYVPAHHTPSQHTASQHTGSQHTARQHATPKPPEQGLGLSSPNHFTKISTNTSSDSTSYVDLKPFSSTDEKMLNTPGLPTPHTPPQHDSPSGKCIDHSISESKNDKQQDSIQKQTSQELHKSDGEMAEYSYDFSASQESQTNVNSNDGMLLNSPKYGMDKSCPVLSLQHKSHSLVSLSDVADLLSDRSSVFDKHSSDDTSLHKLEVTDNSAEKSPRRSNKVSSEESSESLVPSLSNLSLDVHTD